jgi:hypothetical protein
MEQLSFRLPSPPQINVDQLMDPDRYIIYLGKATLQFNGTWHCLANVYGSLCLVEVTLHQIENNG